MFFLCVESALNRALRWLGYDPSFLDDVDTFDKLDEAFYGLLFVLLLASVLLGLDDDDTLFSDALIF